MVDFLLVEEVIERHLAAKLRSLYRSRHLEQLPVEVTLVYILSHPCRVAEDLPHQSVIAVVFPAEFVLDHLPAHTILQTVEVTVILVHVVHVVVTGVMEHMELGVDAQHLLQGVFHGEDAAYHHRTPCLYVCIPGEYLREPFHHSLCDALVLQGSKGSKLAVPSPGILTYQCDFP